jgi:hypothetical protein
MALDEPGPCQSDAEHAITLKTPYPHVCCRKAWALRKLDKKNDAFTELKKAIEEDSALEASHASDLCELQIEADQETEAMSQLKGLGNKFLGIFGMSIDNFQMQQSPDGGYNIQFRKWLFGNSKKTILVPTASFTCSFTERQISINIRSCAND